MQRSWRNLYKIPDMFFCPHRLHKHHETGTSTWHILKYKQCYPQGCVSFAWKCKKFDEGHECPRGKKHVGKDCFSCPFFYDEKNSFQPDLKVPEEEYEEFKRELEDFEEWIGEIRGKRIEVRGRIETVNPHLINRGDNGTISIHCSGALLYFREGIFGYDRFVDPFYARVSFRVYEESGVAEGDEIEMLAELNIDRGRFVFERVGRVEILSSNDNDAVPAVELRRAKYTGSVIDGQPAKCLRCPNGLLIDSEQSDGRSSPRRLMYCTQGVADYRFCPYQC